MSYLLNRENYWQIPEWDGVDTQIGKYIGKNTFKKTLECFRLPKDDIVSDKIWEGFLSFFQ